MLKVVWCYPRYLRTTSNQITAMSTPTVTKRIPYGMALLLGASRMDFPNRGFSVRLGKSGLKVSRIILGMMSYGDSRWQQWILGEKEAIEHVKFA